jgi:hypothetical protein
MNRTYLPEKDTAGCIIQSFQGPMPSPWKPGNFRRPGTVKEAMKKDLWIQRAPGDV